MLFRTHLVFALLITLVLVKLEVFRFVLNWQTLIFFVIVIISCVLPDIDLSISVIGKRTRPVSNLIEVLAGHRGFFHTPYFLVAVFIILFFIYKLASWPFLIGYSSHLLLDMTTKIGIPIWKKKRIRGIIKTGGLLELALFFIFLAIFLSLLYKIFYKDIKNLINNLIARVQK